MTTFYTYGDLLPYNLAVTLQTSKVEEILIFEQNFNYFSRVNGPIAPLFPARALHTQPSFSSITDLTNSESLVKLF
jgi:phospholipase C